MPTIAELLETAPLQVLKRPRSSRGFPIPYAVYQPKGEEPDFRVLDQIRVERCVHDRLCGICGDPIGHWLWLIGGPACQQSRAFRDPPMHELCAAFAARCCPFIAGEQTRYSRRELPDVEGGLALDPYMKHHERRPERMLLFKTRRVTLRIRGADIYLEASRFAGVYEIGAGGALDAPPS